MKIDWLTVTIPYDSRFRWGLPAHDAFLFDERKPARPLPRYERGWRLAGGGLYCVPSEQNRANKRIIQLSGDEMRKTRDMGLTDDEILVLLAGVNAKATRIDCAFDTDNPSARVDDIERAWDDGTMKTKLQELYKNTRKGRKGEPANSIYLGSPQSEQRFVIYDKAKQLKLLEQAWIRVEMRSYGKMAQLLMKDAMDKGGVDRVARAKVRRAIKTNIKWFEDMIAGDDVELTGLVHQSNKLKWLKEQVAPAIDAIPENEPEIKHEVIRWLYARLNVLFPGWTEFK